MSRDTQAFLSKINNFDQLLKYKPRFRTASAGSMYKEVSFKIMNNMKWFLAIVLACTFCGSQAQTLKDGEMPQMPVFPEIPAPRN